MSKSSDIVVEQVINKILESGNIDFIKNYALTQEHFLGYEDEFEFIVNHYEKYNKAPDKITFLDEFSDFNIFKVEETDQYLYDSLFELDFYNKFSSEWSEVRELIAVDPIAGGERLKQFLDNCPTHVSDRGIDIIKNAADRVNVIVERQNAETSYYIKTGFSEIDAVLTGWERGEELVVIFGRTGQGKSWFMIKSLAEACMVGNRIGLISPEMSALKIGYRVDSLVKGFSNTELVTGRIVIKPEEFNNYKEYIENMSSTNNFFKVASMKDFDKRLTVTKLRNFIIQNKLDVVGIDGITYMTDERSKRGDNKTIALTNISEDLMTLTTELHVPIIIAVQSNRGGSRSEGESGNPELENIRDSDGIAQNATKVLSIRQVEDKLDIQVKKHRNGRTGDKFSYYWSPDVGEFRFDDIESQREAYKETVKQLPSGERSNSSKTRKGKPQTYSTHKNIEEYDNNKEHRKAARPSGVREF